VKRAQVVPDVCPCEAEIGDLVTELADDLTAIVADPRTHTAVLLGGSGTAAVEAMLASAVDAGPLLVVDNGAYGVRMAAIARSYGIGHVTFASDPTVALDLDALAATLGRGLDGRAFTHVALVHHETTTGLLNDLAAIGALCRALDAVLLVDAVSSYAAIPIDLATMHVACLASTANKNPQGMPGVAFAIASRAFFEGLPPLAGRGYYLSLLEQHRCFAAERQWRFTPPVPTLYALRQALLEIKLEGVAARYARYSAAWETLLAGLAALGLEPLVAPALQSRLVTAIREPELPGYDFRRMHDYCRARGYTIYPGKLAGRRSFRVATIGAITAADVRGFLDVLGAYLRTAGAA
jgi:2-aminoethylphosphonate-pyruvate transaminase